MIPAVLLAAALTYRVVPLACDGDRIAISGGGILRLDPATTCKDVVPGRAIAIALDDAGHATITKLDPTAKAATEIPVAAYLFAPPAASANGADVLVTITVSVPADTPQNSAIYLGTDRSSFSPAEIQMTQLDARRYRIELKQRDGAQLAFRVSRGTFSTIEREASGRLPAPHVIVAHTGASITVAVAAWADDF